MFGGAEGQAGEGASYIPRSGQAIGGNMQWAKRWLTAVRTAGAASIRGHAVTHLYCLCWNEVHMLPYFFRHYDPLVDRYFIFDDGSTDGSLDLLRQHPRVTLRSFKSENDSFVESARLFYDTAWRESCGRADWVMLVNIDEHLHHPEGSTYFRRCRRKGYTILPAKGYEMVSDQFPKGDTPLYATVKTGIRAAQLDKLCAFNPDAITHIGYGPGRHTSAPQGRVVTPERAKLKLLHYKYLGASYVTERYAQLRERMLAGDRAQRRGWHYFQDAETIAGNHRNMLASASPVRGL